MAAPQRQWGTTPSISWTLPTEKEIKQDAELTDELKRQNQYEAPSETEKKLSAPAIQSDSLLTCEPRHALLAQLQNIAVEFVKHVCKKKSLPQSIVDSAGGKIFTYGSYRLGAYAPGNTQWNTGVSVPFLISADSHQVPILTPWSLLRSTFRVKTFSTICHPFLSKCFHRVPLRR